MSLTADDARKAAARERDAIAQTHEWAEAYHGAAPQDALLVKATPPDEDYYIVEFRQSGRTTGLMLVDASSGEVGELTGIRTPTDSLFRFFRPEEVPQLLEAHGRELLAHCAGTEALAGYSLDFLAGNIRVRPDLVWEPCDQSLTPFYPFYRVEHAVQGRIDRLLVRVDGEVHPKLTNAGRGM